MQVCLLKSKIHRATITDGNLKYEGSLTIAADLMKLVRYEPAFLNCDRIVTSLTKEKTRAALQQRTFPGCFRLRWDGCGATSRGDESDFHPVISK